MGKGKYSQERRQMAARLQMIRQCLDKTQWEMAGVLGISLSGYKKLESGENQISAGSLRRLCQQVEASTDYILFGDNQDINVIWEDIAHRSEQDKLELLLRLVLYFVRLKRRVFLWHGEQ